MHHPDAPQPDIVPADEPFVFEYFGKQFTLSHAVRLFLDEHQQKKTRITEYLSRIIHFQDVDNENTHTEYLLLQLIESRNLLVSASNAGVLNELDFYLFGHVQTVPDLQDGFFRKDEKIQIAQCFRPQEERVERIRTMKVYLEYKSANRNHEAVVDSGRQEIRNGLKNV